MMKIKIELEVEFGNLAPWKNRSKPEWLNN